MKLNVTVDKIKRLNPCQDRLDVFLKHYPDFNGDILEFLALDKITYYDKFWVSVRILPRSILEVFAIDCAMHATVYANAAAYTTAAYAANATAAYAAYYAAYYAAEHSAYAAEYSAYYAAEYSAYAAEYSANTAERERQVNALAYLIETNEEGE